MSSLRKVVQAPEMSSVIEVHAELKSRVLHEQLALHRLRKKLRFLVKIWKLPALFLRNKEFSVEVAPHLPPVPRSQWEKNRLGPRSF
jgi:hypothetical protein